MTYQIHLPARETATETNLDAARATAARLSEEHLRAAALRDACLRALGVA